MGDCTLQRNAGQGLSVLRTSSVTLFGTIVSQINGGSGLSVSSNSSAFTSTTTTSSSTTLRLLNNNQNGLTINNASIASFTGITLTLENNASSGLVVFNVSRFGISAESTLTVMNNGGDGIFIFDTSHVDLSASEPMVIANNAFAGLFINGAASVDFFGPAEIRGNGFGVGVGIAENAHLRANDLTISSSDILDVFNGHLSISSSTISGILASFGSRLRLIDTMFDGFLCDDTVLVLSNVGTVTCPTATVASVKRRSHMPMRPVIPQVEPVEY